MEGYDGSGRKRSVNLRTFPVSCALAIVFLCSLVGHAKCSMDITAFEYHRKFKTYLELGQCPQRERIIRMPDNSTQYEPVACKERQKGNITSLPREFNDSRHVTIPTANDLVAYLGLCGGEAASYLGILNKGDCVAVEMASILTFSAKTMVRAFVQYYRKSLDILETTENVRDGFSHYYTDKFYVKHRSYGTLEIIIVQFRFRSRKETELARELKQQSNFMSDFMKKLEREVGIPRIVLILSLSTATQESFLEAKYDQADWLAAIRYVEVLETYVTHTRLQIESNRISPHLDYLLFPFDSRSFSGRIQPSPLNWEAISMLEVTIRQAVTINKKTTKLCRNKISQDCRRALELRRKLASLKSDIHKARSNWMNLSMKEKQDFAIRYQARVTSFSNVAKILSRDIRNEKKQEKLDKLSNRKRRRNQVPLDQRMKRLRQKRERTAHLKKPLASKTVTVG